MAEHKQFKELEKKIHEQLYTNLLLLSRIYPTSAEFKRIFKKDMFYKNNKAAFHEVVHYLLDILNPQLTKEKLSSWPPYDIKMESKFRSEVLSYINELNNRYDNADIPPIMSSQLISPGGFKFTKFIYKLSQLVMYEHLKKSNRFVLGAPRPGKNQEITRIAIENMKKQVTETECSTRSKMDRFIQLQEELKVKAVSIIEKFSELEQKTVEAKKELIDTKEEFDRKYPNHPGLHTLKDKFLILQREWDSLQSNHELLSEADDLLSYLKGDNLVLEHKADQGETACRSTSEVDLTEFFHRLDLLLQKKSLELPNPSDMSINKKIEEMKKLNETMSQREREIEERRSRSEGLVKEMFESLKCIDELISTGQGNNELPEILITDGDM